MNFSIPAEYSEDVERFKEFLNMHLVPNQSAWYREGALPRSFHLQNPR